MGSAAPEAMASPPFGAVLERLATLVGFAPSDVLANRLRRAAPLVARCVEARCSIEDPDWAALLDAVTVQETRLFRAAPQIACFRTAVLPNLLAAARGRSLRLVSAGCATGEEAWTLAMLAGGPAAEAGVACQVLGLDLSRPALAAAERARYHLGPPDALREVPEADRALLDITGSWFEPAARLRPLVRFRRANLLDPGLPAGEADVILCRNVLIYLTEPARQVVLTRLAAALRPGGALVLGATDQPPPELGLRRWASDVLSIWRRDHA